ncbi:MAG: RNA degradosome polyphosphate kinase, partial [Nitrospira sp.]|nr:RNA degradosome polyphosphate kinase [Nitrospira sp.]
MIDQSAGSGESAAEPEQSIDESRHLLNRELSWLRFNLRVLEEAEDKRHPLLERVKFLAIFATNLDEFFMIRVSGLHRQVAGGVVGTTPDGMTPSEQILTINRELMIHYERYDTCWKQDVLPGLAEAGIRILHYAELAQREREAIQGYFQREIFPVLTPLAFDPTHPFPHISSLSFNLAVLVKDPERGDCFARVKVPDVFPRLVPIPTDEDVARQQMGLGGAGGVQQFVWLEEVIA